MKRFVQILTTLVVALSLAGSVGAQDAPSAEEAADEAQVFNFEEDEIRTDFLKPNTLLVEGLRRGRSSVLISVRLTFVDEIVKSAEDI